MKNRESLIHGEILKNGQLEIKVKGKSNDILLIFFMLCKSIIEDKDTIVDRELLEKMLKLTDYSKLSEEMLKLLAEIL